MNFSFGTNYALPKLSLKSDAGVVTGNVIRGKGNEPPSICTKVGGVFLVGGEFKKFIYLAAAPMFYHNLLSMF